MKYYSNLNYWRKLIEKHLASKKAEKEFTKKKQKWEVPYHLTHKQ